MVTGKVVKYTKNNEPMCFVTIEDLVGTVEVIVFPKSYVKYNSMLADDEKILVKGRVSAEEDKDAKLICEDIVTFEEALSKNGEEIFSKSGFDRRSRFRRGGYNGGSAGNGYGGSAGNGGNTGGKVEIPKTGLFLQFANREEYDKLSESMLETMADSDGNDDVIIYIKDTKSIKVLPPNKRVGATEELRTKLAGLLGEANVVIKKQQAAGKG